ncbi:LPS export ABC transporter ATP-binding protein [Deferribacterales bacterium Es71-Z0220]|jgi:lipopolysaccharide export system ATP-binding protein|uniref:LPS export ABC transporter ATP-binding protein n=1 Tax=Deferrivibrio essentukiensis TaxID=2880922 RepID=UPI001F601C29|nr:LPS export ABC transporter ATP-binding protein [Deferrivibrio essentukiensis]MCB4204497.1 LPS export ABC transporter ATP-binding protein [Deferrivibrio essentukiensis]
MELRTNELIKRYKDRNVVDGVSLKVREGEIVGLLGPNGAGKTTTFYMVVGIVRPDSGDVYLDDKKITNLPIHERAKYGIGYLPQEASIFRKLTVEENILSALQIIKYPKNSIKERCNELIDEFGLEKVRKSYGYALSGGERRRVEIARCLAVNPKYILLDEPFAGIDPISVTDIQNMVFTLKKRGIGVLITDHNVRETLKITDRSYIVFEGKVLAEGDKEHIINHREVVNRYLGEGFTLQ